MNNPFKKEQMPEVKIGPHGVFPESWEEIRRWANRNDPHWNKYERIARINNLSEVERLKVLLVHYLQVQQETLKRLIKTEEEKTEIQWLRLKEGTSN